MLNVPTHCNPSGRWLSLRPAGIEMQGKPAMNEKMKMEEMDKMIMEQNQKLFPMILVGAFVSHIAFGVALGLVVTPIVKRSAEKSGR